MDQNGMHRVEVEVQVQGDVSNFVAKEEFNVEQDLTPEDQEKENVTANTKGKEGCDFKMDNTNITSQFDTTDAFNEVFGDRRDFDSWDEFTGYLEAFQTKSGTRFKARAACRVSTVNERRIGQPIPDRFVYASVDMICVHYGNGGTGKRKSYVARGCQALLRVSHSRGAMRVTRTTLTHYNHDPIYEENHKLSRNFKVFNFTEELDQIIAMEVLKANPFQYKFTNGEKKWTKVLKRLKNGDERFATITPRLVKLRIRFLLDNFAAITEGRIPPPEDEMGTILYKLDIAKKEGVQDNPSSPVATRKRGRGRPSKVSLSDCEDDPNHDDDDDYVADSPSSPASTRPKRKRGRPRKFSSSDCDDVLEEDDSFSYSKKKSKKSTSTHAPLSPTLNVSFAKSVSNDSGDGLSQLVSYLQRKDQEDRKLRQKELEADRRLRQNELEEDRKLRQTEIDLRKEELAFQKERFEFEKTERKAQMELLTSQLQVFESTVFNRQHQQQ